MLCGKDARRPETFPLRLDNPGCGLYRRDRALGFGRFAYTPILPAMKDALSLSYTQMGWIGTGNLIGYLAFSLLGGYWATRIGSRQIISISLTVVAIGLILTGLSNSFEFALLMRSLTGAGSAGSNVPFRRESPSRAWPELC